MPHARNVRPASGLDRSGKVLSFVAPLPGLRRGKFRTELERGESPALHHASRGPPKLQERLSAAYLPMVWTDDGLDRSRFSFPPASVS